MLLVVMIAAGVGLCGLDVQSPRAAPLSDVLARSAAYLTEYEQKFSAVVSEERYTQQLLNAAAAGTDQHRVTRADVLLVSLGPNRWLGFRDIYELNGSKIRDHDQRLQKLFLESPGELVERATEMSNESARFNLGSVRRTINLPMMALQYLEVANQTRSEFRVQDNETVDGVQTVVIEFMEKAQPTIVRDTRGNDQPAAGRFRSEEHTSELQSRLHLVC